MAKGIVRERSRMFVLIPVLMGGIAKLVRRFRRRDEVAEVVAASATRPG